MTKNPSKASILLVEDQAELAEILILQLETEGFSCQLAASITTARRLIKSTLFDLVLLDVNLPDGNGIDFLKEIKDEIAPNLPVVNLTSFAIVEDAVRSLKAGADDYLQKPEDPTQTILVLERILAHSKRRKEIEYAKERESHANKQAQLIGSSDAMQQVRNNAEKISQLVGNDISNLPVVLITGETGCGKGEVAKYLHQQSPNRDKPFVTVDCASLPPTLIESELFGHAKGAFTQAERSRTGLIEAAEDGTIFLDEIGELPLDLQTKFLAVLDRRSFRPVGSDKEKPARARFISATNRNLKQQVADGKFRADLYYRLNVLSISLPPLRERDQDSIELAKYFSGLIARKYGLQNPSINKLGEEAILNYAWPGNVRELQHIIERTMLLHPGSEIDPSSVLAPSETPPKPSLESQASIPSETNLELIEKQVILRVLSSCDGNVSKAALKMGVSRGSLRSKLAKHGIE